MTNEPKWQSSILAVDDEPGILEAYRQTLVPASQSTKDVQNLISRWRGRRSNGLSPSARPAIRPKASYTLFTAASGEEAVEIVRQELAAGRQIAAGFFDMSMPGGIDGQETIHRIQQLDNQILCAVVTAYTDRSPDQLGTLFARQDDWLYFNKPFTTGELQQTAHHLVTAWNQRRREEALISNLEMMRNGLAGILQTVCNINRIPPLMLDSLLEGVLAHFLALVPCADGFIRLNHEGMGPLQLGAGVFMQGTPGQDGQDERFLAERAMAAKKSIIEENRAATPLLIDNQVYGVLYVQAQSVIGHDPNLLDMYAVQAVNMIQNSQLYEQLDRRTYELSAKNQELVDLLGKLTRSEDQRAALETLSYMDCLTGIPNRRYLEQCFQEELARAQRYKLPFTCVMVDIDHFKKVNDTHGHLVGDQVLKKMGEILRAQKRPYDIVGRYGGEEFAIILKEISAKDSLLVCERLRVAVAQSPFAVNDAEFNFTVSIGIASLYPREGVSMETIWSLADKALYRAKEGGRNRCVLDLPPAAGLELSVLADQAPPPTSSPEPGQMANVIIAAPAAQDGSTPGRDRL